MKKANSIIIATITLIGIGLFWTMHDKAEANSKVIFEFGDACRNVVFRFTNGRSDEIQITKVHYYNRNEEKWKTETLPYNSCYSNQVCYLPQQDLGDSEGDNITRIKYEYKIRPNRSDGQWSGNYTSSEFRPESPRCNAGKTYGLGQNWWIMPNRTSNSNENDGILSGDKCKNVMFKLTNGKDNLIRIKKIKYYNRQSGKWDTIDVANYQIESGNSRILDRGNSLRPDGIDGKNYIDLKDANGDDITKIIFVYEVKSNQPGSNWGDPVNSRTFEPADPTCREGKTYGQGQLWTIGGGSNESQPVRSDSNVTNRTNGKVKANPTMVNSGQVVTLGTPAPKNQKGETKKP